MRHVGSTFSQQPSLLPCCLSSFPFDRKPNGLGLLLTSSSLSLISTADLCACVSKFAVLQAGFKRISDVASLGLYLADFPGLWCCECL
jgi:hypothetical protein